MYKGEGDMSTSGPEQAKEREGFKGKIMKEPMVRCDKRSLGLHVGGEVKSTQLI